MQINIIKFPKFGLKRKVENFARLDLKTREKLT